MQQNKCFIVLPLLQSLFWLLGSFCYFPPLYVYKTCMGIVTQYSYSTELKLSMSKTAFINVLTFFLSFLKRHSLALLLMLQGSGVIIAKYNVESLDSRDPLTCSFHSAGITGVNRRNLQALNILLSSISTRALFRLDLPASKN